ncbi:MAG: type II secretion system protein [Candidatus Neomarinimicrobiota bacterium]
MKTNQKGFTLIELVMVIVILGILAAVAIPRFINLTTKAEVAAEDGIIGALRSGVLTYSVNMMASGNTTNLYPSDPFDALQQWPTGYDSSDHDAADAASEWTFNTSDSTVSHMRKDGSTISTWDYDPSNGQLTVLVQTQ